MKLLKKVFARLSSPLPHRMGVGLCLIALLTLAACSGDDDKTVTPASEKMMKEVTGHWLATIPLSGEVSNWRSEEGEMTTYDHIDALVYLNGWVTTGKGSFWGYIYIQDGEMVNYDGIDRSKDDPSGFDFAMDSKGHITPNSHLANAPMVTDMHYDHAADIITANVTYKGHTLAVVFNRPTDEQEEQLNEVFEMLLEAGIIGGYEDDGYQVQTDVTDDPADEPSRARGLSEE